MRRKTQEIWKRTGKPERDLKRGTKKAIVPKKRRNRNKKKRSQKKNKK